MDLLNHFPRPSESGLAQATFKSFVSRPLGSRHLPGRGQAQGEPSFVRLVLDESKAAPE